tara:strand:- start:7438 stop:8406 length:969 start_codon:yes stop_codon:yes gene_type:complete
VKEQCKLVAGSSNIELARKVAKIMDMPLMPVDLKKFNDGELYCRILESVRGSDVYILQPTSPDVNDNLMELLIISDALKRSSPYNITAVVPYFGYCRQDKKHKSREPITAKLVANMMMVSGINRLITFDLHAAPVQGFFDIPSDNLEVMPLFADYVVDKKFEDIVVVSPDAGGVPRARALAKELDVPIAIIDKRRPKPNVAEVMHVIGDVEGKTALIVDDIIDTGGSVVAGSEMLLKHGAKEVYVFASHALFSKDAKEKLGNSPIKEVVVTDTISISEEKRFDKLKVMCVDNLLAEAITRTHQGKPMGVVYDDMREKIQQKR